MAGLSSTKSNGCIRGAMWQATAFSHAFALFFYCTKIWHGPPRIWIGGNQGARKELQNSAWQHPCQRGSDFHTRLGFHGVRARLEATRMRPFVGPFLAAFAHKNSSRLGFAEPKCLHRRTSRKRRWVLFEEDSRASNFQGRCMAIRSRHITYWNARFLSLSQFLSLSPYHVCQVNGLSKVT